MANQNIFETKSDFVYKSLKQKIIKGILDQGENIKISKVAKEYEISSIPVREALKRLEMEGLVVIAPHKGATVTTFDAKKTNEILSIRAILEGYAARTSVDFIDEDKMKQLKDMVYEMDVLAKNKDDENFSYANKEFHRFIYKQSPFKTLYDMTFNLWDGGNWSKSVFAFSPERMRESTREHLEILAAIEEKDGEKVEQLTRKHKVRNLDILYKLSK